ncbi:hypothetical protein QQ008_14305 [Fulvivirgaceae bacterium BMA10]|uniref:Adhesin domain-containing protein n=1 Tax=Splendidivirga corallicola TaxID=3051826 RepID=A0ABT8KPC0_9BACT|nr:hypothetical protein [Fulvivirgaceae bacterium BMA10]
MKKHILSKRFVIVALIFSCLLVWKSEANSKYDKKKEIKKTFKVTKDANLELHNRFGEVHVNTWDKNEITAEITVIAKTSDDRRAQEILDRIEINIMDNSPSGTIKIKTEIEQRSRSWFSSSSGDNFEINYLISMPKTNDLEVTHSHGDLYIDQLNGDVSVNLSHGRIKTEELNGDGYIKLAHGNGGGIKSLNNGRLTVSHYRKLNIDYLGSVDVGMAHTSFDILKADDLELEVRHSNFGIGEINKLDCDLAHSNLDLGTLNNSIEVTVSHGNVDIERVSSNFSSIELRGSHSDFDLNLDRGASAKLDLGTSHGSVKYDRSAIDFDYISEQSHSAKYRGTLGNQSSPKSRIFATASHGDIRIYLR